MTTIQGMQYHPKSTEVVCPPPVGIKVSRHICTTVDLSTEVLFMNEHRSHNRVEIQHNITTMPYEYSIK